MALDGMDTAVKPGLPPIAAADARVIILGSLPGDRSLLQQRYYAHPSNQFWRLVGRTIGEELAGHGYDERLAILARHRIGLWDVIGSAERSGSLDQAIRLARTNALADWIGGFPGLRAIGFNGRTASIAGRRALANVTAVDLIDLPSSSAAHTMSFADKAERWAMLTRYLDDGSGKQDLHASPHAPQ